MINAHLFIAKFNELYVLYRKKYLILDAFGYKTIQSTNERKINLTDKQLLEHLKYNNTIGVFAGSIFTKFICFDVDVKNKSQAKMTVYILVNALQELGISDKYIYVSFSGNKGYHVEIFFDKPVSNELIKEFYLLVLNHAGLLNFNEGKVELRPTAQQGVKLPLGKHFGTGNICWYCDYYKRLKPIERPSYILEIKQIDTDYFCDLMERYSDNYVDDDRIAKKCEDIIEKYTPLPIYKENVDQDYTIEAIEQLIINGLTVKGSRHNSLVKIAKYNKHIGMNLNDNKQFLLDWMDKQDCRLYSTTWKDCVSDIDKIVKWIYESNCSLIVKNLDIKVSTEEMLEIIKIDGKNDKVVLYSMLIHKKRYATNDGLFYMTYKQMQDSTGLCEHTVINIIKRLESNNIISVIRNDNKEYNPKYNIPMSQANKYSIEINLLSAKTYKSENPYQFKVCDKQCENCFAMCLFRLLDKKEAKKLLPRRQFEAFSLETVNVKCVNS